MTPVAIRRGYSDVIGMSNGISGLRRTARLKTCSSALKTYKRWCT
jgi:hypothetical protein